jgi:chemotaxis regulatin CheY-phosphate phosphatase CheZ
MTTEANKRAYDCVAATREIRDRLGAKMLKMSPEQRVQWLNTREFSDPVLRRLATRTQPRKTA